MLRDDWKAFTDDDFSGCTPCAWNTEEEERAAVDYVAAVLHYRNKPTCTASEATETSR